MEHNREQKRSYARIRASSGLDAGDRELDTATAGARREVARQAHDYARDLNRGRYEDDCHVPGEATEIVRTTREEFGEAIEAMRSLRDTVEDTPG